MYSIYDYLDPDLAGKPYTSLNEHRKDNLGILWFLLDSFIAKRTDDPEKYYTPGIVMTDEQARRYYEEKPVDRDSCIFDDEVASEADGAIKYIESREKATKNSLMLPLKMIRQEFELSFFEQLCVLMSLALAVNVNIRNLYAYIGNDAALKHPTAGIAYSLFSMVCPDADVSMLDNLCRPDGKMAVYFFRSVENMGRVSSLMDTPIVLRNDMQGFLLGRSHEEDIPYCTIYNADDLDIEPFAGMKSSFPDKEEGSVVFVESRNPSDVPQLLIQCGYSDIHILHADRLSKDTGTAGAGYAGGNISVRLGRLYSHIRLFGGNVLVSITDRTDPDFLGMLIASLRKHIPGRNIFFCGTERITKDLASGRDRIFTIRLPYPDVESREKLWDYYIRRTGMKISEDLSIANLADCYEISLTGIRQIVYLAHRKAVWNGKDELKRADLKEHLFALSEMGLSRLATYIPSSFTWDNLQIDPAQRKVLMVACERFRHRNRIGGRLRGTGGGTYGNGVSVLLCGPPGTGKTMAAQVVSEELQLPLYRIDVSQIYSKYLGETQKNLGEVFDEAAKSNVILFFDEADALFTKRTEVSDSHDKYANAETAYLLQKIEAHSGMVLLATNLFKNFDTAFVRRLTYVVRFNKPDEEVRLSLWRTILPGFVKVSPDLDYEFFAEKFDIPGSSIKAILYSAMYMAQAQDRELTNRDIVQAMKYEFEKNGVLNDTSKFGPYSAYLYE